MSKVAAPTSYRYDGSRAIAPMFFVTPLMTSAVPRLTWLFFFLIAICLIGTFLRRGGNWRQLIQPNIAVTAALLVAVYAFISFTWAADQKAAISETCLLLAVVLATVAASTALATLDKQQLQRAALAFIA